jgi:hypothetical protein
MTSLVLGVESRDQCQVCGPWFFQVRSQFLKNFMGMKINMRTKLLRDLDTALAW